MDEKDSQAPFPREAWKRLLEDPAEGPPETTDARIRAAARRVVVPASRRWWLPASLAASFVVAFLLAQSQLRKVHEPVMTESDSGPAGEIAARIERGQADATRAAGKAPAAPSRSTTPAREEAELEDSGYTDPEFAADAAVAGPLVGGPEQDLKSASERPEEAPAASPPPAVMDSADSTTPSSVADSTRARPLAESEMQGVAPTAIAAKLPAPEAWYARIEQLRKQGRVDEANRELERLEKAYPGWLERHLQERAPR
jgi:hypothetical protein